MAKKKKTRFRSGFRKNETTKHPAYTYSNQNEKIQYVSITHSNKMQGVIPLSKNPNPDENRQSYILPDPYEDNPKNFSRRYKNWKFSEKDKDKVRSVMKKPVKKNK